MVMPRSVETCPSSGSSSPAIIRNSVVLPAPFGPTSPIFSPLRRPAEASMNRIWWPTCLLTLSRRIMSARTWGEMVGRSLGHVERARKPEWRESRPDLGRLVPLEILHVALVFFRRRARFEGAEIAPLAGLRIDLAGIEPVFARLQFSDHAGALARLCFPC